MQIFEIVTEQYPPRLKDGREIAEYIERTSSAYVDAEMIEENYIGAYATLMEVPIKSVRPGNADANIASKSKERRYAKMKPETMPPIVIEDGEIRDGHHRYRVALKQGRPTIRAYVIEWSDD